MPKVRKGRAGSRTDDMDAGNGMRHCGASGWLLGEGGRGDSSAGLSTREAVWDQTSGPACPVVAALDRPMSEVRGTRIGNDNDDGNGNSNGAGHPKCRARSSA